jgi:hypothetical protein
LDLQTVDQQVTRLWAAISVLWGVALALLLCRHFFLAPANTFFKNHDENTYLIRLIEFRDCLRSGYASPQWCTDFRSGLGSPYFGYYQPGVFYAASLVPSSLGPVRQFGCVTVAFAVLGYVSMWGLVKRHFGRAAAVTAGTLLLTSCYCATELYIRGDFSEFAASMLLVALLFFLDWWLAKPKRRAIIGVAACGAGLVVMHPCVALSGYGLSVAFVVLTSLWNRRWRDGLRAGLGLTAGAGMASFYWMPVLLEWDYISADRAFSGFFHYSNHFLSLRDIFGFDVTHTVIPVKVGLLATGVLVGAAAICTFGWRRLLPQQRRISLVALLTVLGCLFLMNRSSAPVWEAVTLLQRLQFPWRLFAVLGVAAAMAGGVVAGVLPSKLKLLMAAAVTVTATTIMVANTRVTLVPARVPQTAAQIRDSYFAPDIANGEWLPKGAKAGDIDPSQRQPVAGPGVRVGEYRMAQGRLECAVSAEADSYVIVPHYFFPVGWTARVNDQPVTLRANHTGLMRVELPAGARGTLRVTFRMTPMRRLGLGVSAVSLLGLGGLLLSPWCRTMRPAGGARQDMAPAIARLPDGAGCLRPAPPSGDPSGRSANEG